MKIGVKITLIVVIAVIGLAVISIFSISGIEEVNDMFTYCGDKPIANANTANEALDELNDIARSTAMMIVVEHDKALLKQFEDRAENAAKSLGNKLDTLLVNCVDSAKPLVKDIQDKVHATKDLRLRLQQLLDNKNYEAAATFRATEYQTGLFNAIEAVGSYVSFTDEQIHQYVYVTSEETVSKTEMTMFVVIGIVLVLLIVVAVIIITGITKPLKKAVTAAEKVSQGDLNVDLETKSKDETGTLLNAFQIMVGSINAVIKDTEKVAAEAVAGHLSFRVDVGKHNGAYKDMVVGVNEIVNVLVGHLQNTADYLQKISQGIVPTQIVEQSNGDFNDIRNSVNTCIESLNYLISNIKNIAENAENGILDKRADSSKVKNAWAVLLNGVNGIVSEADTIINDAGKTLSIMATGDLTPRVTTDYKGKFGEMKDNINNLGDSLTDLISQLQEAIHTTASASAEISSTADTLAAATQEQSSQTDEVATAMEEMSRTVTDNAHSATRTADVARQSGEVANNGGKVVQQTVEKMREIAAVVKMSADNIAKLGESSKKIGEIISVIDDIADQTNLLSLNAAIEAARAGEQGRGFAVVADSVGKLAVSTASATKEIADMIKGIQTDTELAVKAMEKGTTEVQSGIELADNAGHSLQDILSGINELLDMVNQIAAASEQQSATSEEISKNVSSISKVTGDSARNVEDVAATANELARMTETLTSLVSQFKVSPKNFSSRALEVNNGGGSYLE